MMLAAVFRPWGIVVVVDDILFNGPLVSHAHTRAHAEAHTRHSPAAHAHPHAGMTEAAMEQRLYTFESQRAGSNSGSGLGRGTQKTRLAGRRSHILLTAV